ncbi:MAG: metallophosphoesterase [Desulfomonile tiedjei]|nr:metallophosphoesterase [Desulfomonile tiedjei]
MTKIFWFLAAISTLFLLCQWYIFVSVRRYLFERYQPVSRRVGYSVLAILGIANFAAIQLSLQTTFGIELHAGKQFAAVAFFTYLGAVLFLCLFFLLMGGIAQVIDLIGATVSWVHSLLRDRVPLPMGQRGCINAACRARSKELPGEGVSEIAPPERAAVATEQGNPAAADSRLDTEPAVSSPARPTRRAFLKWSAAAGMVAVTGYAGNGLAEAYRSATVEQFDLFHPALKGLTKPLTLIHITDFHFGMFFGNQELEALVDHLNALEGDALLITGDIFHSPLTPVESAASILKNLKQRRLGNFVVLGNHDFYAGEWRSVAAIRESGLELLRNQWLTFNEGNTRIHLGGIDDPVDNWIWGANFPEFSSFAEKAPQADGFRILLSHRPSVMPLASRAGMNLVLAGHTHGGQIILPVPGNRGLSLARVASPYTHGWYRSGSSRMYLSRGVGLTFIPWRVNCPPEISVFHLRPAVDGKTKISRTDGAITGV